MIDDRFLRLAHKRAFIIAVAMMIIPFIYVIAGELVLKDLAVDDSFLYVHARLRYILIAIAAAEIIAVSIIKPMIVSGKIKTGSIKSSVPGVREEIDKNSPKSGEAEFVRRLFLGFLISYAIWSTIATYGLILFILGKDTTEFYAFIGVSLFLMLVHFPKYDDWESRLKDLLT
jgi:hypothetical protein